MLVYACRASNAGPFVTWKHGHRRDLENQVAFVVAQLRQHVRRGTFLPLAKGLHGAFNPLAYGASHGFQTGLLLCVRWQGDDEDEPTDVPGMPRS